MKPKENMEIGKQLSFALYGAANRMNRLHKPFLDPLGLTFPQYLVMLELFCGTPRAVGELGNKLDMDTGTITPLLKRLEASGKVKRTRDPADERRVLITLTEAGDALQEELWCITDKIKTACRLSEEGLAQLRDTLNALSHPASDQAAYKYTVSKELIMKIGIIGAGNIGATLAGKLSAGGHEIKLANSRGPDSIRDLARKVGATAVTREEAVKDVDAIILAIPFEKHRGLANLFSQVPESVVVIDTSNYYPFRDSAIAEVDDGKPESVWASEQTGRQLVKAWNAALAGTLADKGLPSGAPGRIALPVAGDDPRAKAVVFKLVSETGFDALDAGPLSESWRQQPGTPAYCTELDITKLKKALSVADAARAPKNRDELIKVFMTPDAHFAHEEVIARNREVTA